MFCSFPLPVKYPKSLWYQTNNGNLEYINAGYSIFATKVSLIFFNKIVFETIFFTNFYLGYFIKCAFWPPTHTEPNRLTEWFNILIVGCKLSSTIVIPPLDFIKSTTACKLFN